MYHFFQLKFQENYSWIHVYVRLRRIGIDAGKKKNGSRTERKETGTVRERKNYCILSEIFFRFKFQTDAQLIEEETSLYQLSILANIVGNLKFRIRPIVF